MDLMSLLYFALIGIAAGFLAGQILKGRGFGLLGNLIVGVIGAIVGGWLVNFLGFSTNGGLLNSLITAVIGAVALLFVVGLIRKNT